MELKEYYEKIMEKHKNKEEDILNFIEKYSQMEPAKYWSPPSKMVNREQKIANKINKDNYIATAKVDGEWHRFIFGDDNNYKLQTRNISRVTGEYGNKTHYVPHLWNEMIMANIPEETVLLAEIYYPNKKANEVGKIMRCKADKAIKRQNGDYGKLHMYIFDILSINGIDLENTEYIKRIYLLNLFKTQYFNNSKYIKVAKPTLIKNYESALEAMAKEVENNREGIVLNKADEIYRPGKRKAWSSIKFKPQQTVDAIITNIMPSTKYYEGTEIEGWQYWINENTEEKEMGNYNGVPHMKPITKYYYYNWPSAIEYGFYSKTGKTIQGSGTVSSGLSDEILEDMAKNPENYYGHPVELNCMEITEDKKLRHPIFVRVREDINIEECTEEKI